MKRSLASFLSLALVLSACGTASGPDSDMTTYKIGVISPLGGEAAVVGQQLQNVYEHVLPMINENYADQGIQFELVYEDGQCAGNAAVTAFQKLRDVDGVTMILGGSCSSESLAIAPLADEAGIVLLSPTSSSPELVGVADNLFSLSYSDSIVGQNLADELAKYEKVAMLSEQNEFNQAMVGVARAALDANEGVEVVYDEEFENGGTDFRNQLQEILAAEPDVFFMNPFPGVTTEAMVRQMAELEWNVPIVSNVALRAEAVLTVSPELLEGAVMLDSPVLNNPDLDVLVESVTTEQGPIDAIGNYYVASGADALILMAELAVKHEGDAMAVREELATGNFEGYLGEISFDGNTFVQGIGAARYEVQDGELVPVE